MKILVISSHEQNYGGGEGRIAFEFAVELSRRHEVVLLYPGTAPAGLKLPAGLRIYTYRSIDYTVPAMTAGELRKLFRFLNEFKPDVVHSHTWFFLGAIVQAWARMRKVPFYLTCHELPSRLLVWGLVRYLKGISRTAMLRVLTRIYLLTIFRGCDVVVALNQAAADDIRSTGYRGPLDIIPNGRTLSLYDGREPADLGAPLKTLTFVGDFYERKNQKFLVSMMSHLPAGYRLVLIGHEVDHRYRREIDSEMPACVRSRVSFTGRLDHGLVPDYLARTHLWVSASTMEVQSIAVMEALASGTPVLGLSNETIDELVDSSVGRRLSRDADPREFAQAVRSICEQDERSYAVMCQNARHKVRPFDWRTTIQRAERMYASAPRGSTPRRRGSMALPALLAVSQMLIAMLLYLVLQAMNLVARLQKARVARTPVNRLRP
jgi:glycosyltransferase involved in cell wall biosynthesis